MLKFKRELKFFFNLLKENNLLEEFIFNYNNDIYYRNKHTLYNTQDLELEEYLTLYIKNNKSYRIISDAFSWNHRKILKTFYDFLLSKKTHDKYFNNYIKHNCNVTKETFINFLIFTTCHGKGHHFFTTAFTWSNTKEGMKYWRNLNDEWTEILFNLTENDYGK